MPAVRRHPPRTNKEMRMNKMDLIEHVAGEMDMSRSAANRAVDTIIDGITKALKKGEEVRITGFGTFTVKKRAAGKGRNPATGEAIKIPASKNARFKAGATLKAAVNKAR
ncbi:MAG TPA: HU family DNA-binding protein [Beijerinckiaceae bacterium]|nr:HU family DNA-binding protein [Beijerinckiaceae bacterium]